MGMSGDIYRVPQRYIDTNRLIPGQVPLYALHVPAQSVPWVSVSRCLPNPEEHPRVLIYTEEYAFDGEQVFDVRAEGLNERFFTHPDEQPEVCRVASHWMPHPANTNLTAAPKLEESK